MLSLMMMFQRNAWIAILEKGRRSVFQRERLRVYNSKFSKVNAHRNGRSGTYLQEESSVELSKRRGILKSSRQFHCAAENHRSGYFFSLDNNVHSITESSQFYLTGKIRYLQSGFFLPSIMSGFLKETPDQSS